MTKTIRIGGMLLAVLQLAMACAKSEENKTTSSGGAAVCTATEVIEGLITSNRTIAANSCVAIKGAVTVISGVTLTVGAGTTVLADTSTLSYLKVNRGGTLNAIGTAAAPIVFTSGAAVGSRSPSDWGGIVIHGKSATNQTTSVNFAADTEIFTGPYGCGDTGNACTGTPALSNDDNSGTLQYVRIEFAGREIASGKEFNGLFLAGVGKGTTIDHIQVHRGSDDGIEIFGGAVDIRHAILTNNQDDQFDLDEGWRGIAQYVVAAVPKDGDQGIEYDGVGADANRSTNAPFSNFTIVGSVGKTIEGAISVRASGTMSLYNSYLAHFWGTNGVVAVANNSVTNATATPATGFGTGTFDLRFESNYIECIFSETAFSTAKSGLNDLFCTGNQPAGCAADTLIGRFPDTTGTGNNNYVNNCSAPKLNRPGDNVLWGVTSGVAEFIPSANITVATYTDPQAAPNGTDMPIATYIGAFAAGDTWANGWTAFPVN